MLENGYFQYGEVFAGNGTTFAEFVFNTAMTGYEEILTDPSYKGQVVVFTYPLIGNYGITRQDNQSKKINAEGIIIREASNIVSNFRSVISLSEYLESENVMGMDKVDTRALTKQLRQEGAMKGGFTTENLDSDSFLKDVLASASISDSNLYELVINQDVISYEGTKENNLKLFCIDFGIKSHIIENLKSKFNKIYLVPFNDKFESYLSSIDFDAVFLSNGPGDPRVVTKIENYIKKFIEAKKPVIGICFGHQLIGRAFNLDVIKLKFGHHGGNHPVKFLNDGKVYITAQNHNYAISKESLLADGNWLMTWENLFDNSVEGIKHKHLPISCVQFHPEASPGPNESCKAVFDDFYKTVVEAVN